MSRDGEGAAGDAFSTSPAAGVPATDVPDPVLPSSDAGAGGPTRGGLAWLRWILAFLGAGATSLLGLTAMMMIGMGCTDCSSSERNMQGLLMLVALVAGPAIGFIGLWAADRGWRPWLIWAGLVGASIIGVNNLLWSNSYGR